MRCGCTIRHWQQGQQLGSVLATQVLATIRRELFRTLLLQRIDFFDRHDSAELTSLISNELDSLRTLVFKCALMKRFGFHS